MLQLLLLCSFYYSMHIYVYKQYNSNVVIIFKPLQQNIISAKQIFTIVKIIYLDN